MPRHRYWLEHAAQRAGGKQPPGGGPQAFPLNALKCSDAEFVKLCGTALEPYEHFKAQLLGAAEPAASDSDSSDDDV